MKWIRLVAIIHEYKNSSNRISYNGYRYQFCDKFDYTMYYAVFMTIKQLNDSKYLSFFNIKKSRIFKHFISLIFLCTDFVHFLLTHEMNIRFFYFVFNYNICTYNSEF